MQKSSFMKTSGSTLSIDISNPEGMSSFWNLFSKNNKKEDVQSEDKNEKPKINSKLNSVALKLLKLKGIDLTNLENYDKSDFQKLKQNNNRVIVINPNQLNLNNNDVLKGNMLLDALNNQNSPKNKNGFGINIISSSACSIKSNKGLIKSSITYLRLKKPKVNDFTNRREMKLSDKYDKAFNILSSASSKSVMFKSVPTSKLKKSKRKRVIVPVYVGKEKSHKSNNLEKETILDGGVQDETFDVASLITKIKTMEEKLNSLERKAKRTKENIPWQISQTNSFIPNSSIPLKTFQREGGSLIGNRAETNIGTFTELQTLKKNNKTGNGNVYTQNHIGKRNQNTVSYDDCSENVNRKRDEKRKHRMETFADILTNPDILIKNHNLIVPRDVSKESLFQANPYAGCDTILKLFKALSQNNDNNNQPTNTAISGSRENIQDARKVRNHSLENISEVDTNQSHSSVETNIETLYESHREKNNVSKIKDNFPNIFADKNLGNSCSKINQNGLRNIFSLPLNLSILKSFEHKPSYEKNSRPRLFDIDNSKANRGIQNHKNTEEQAVTISVSEEKQTFYVEDATESRKKSIQNQDKIAIENVVNNDNVKRERESEEFHNETSIKSKLDQSQSCDSRLIQMDIDVKRDTSRHQLHDHSASFGEEVTGSPACNISVETPKVKRNCSVNMLHLNISQEQRGVPGLLKQPQKLFKKTTISCPVKMPERKVSITILIENHLEDEKNVIINASPYAETHSHPQFGVIKVSNSSPNLINYNSEKDEEVEKKIVKATEELPGAFGSLSYDESTPLCRRTITYDINARTGYEQQPQNDCGKTKRFGFTSNLTYLTQEQRKVFDKEVLRVKSYEKSIDFSNFKVKPEPKNPFSSLKYGKGLINILSESSIDSQTANKSNQCKQNPQYNSMCLKNPFYMQSFSVQKQSTVLNTEVAQQDNSFSRNTETTNILPRCLSSDQIHSFSKKENGSTDNEQVLKQQIKNHLGSPELSENSNSGDVSKRTCRFSSTLNQESIVRQAEKKCIFLKNSENDHREEHNTVSIEQNHDDESSNNCLDVLAGRSNNGLELSIKNSQKKEFDKTDINKIEDAQNNSNFYDANLDDRHGEDKMSSTMAERLLQQILLMETEIERNHVETKLNCFRYETNDDGIQSSRSSNYDNIQNNNSQSQEVIKPEVLFNQSKEEIKIETNFDSSLECKNVSSQNVLNKTGHVKLQNEKEKEIKYDTIKARSCQCCTSGCLTVISEGDLRDIKPCLSQIIHCHIVD